MAFRFTIALVLSLVCFATPAVASAEFQTFTATHTYVLGDRDSKEDGVPGGGAQVRSLTPDRYRCAVAEVAA